MALVFGRAGAPLEEHADLLKANWLRQSSEPLDLKRLSPDEAKQEPGSVTDALYSASLFGGSSLILTHIQKESDAAPFLDALKDIEERGELPSGRLLMIAGDLTTRSKLRKTVEASKAATSLQFFERTAREFEQWVRDKIQAEKIPLEPDAEHLLVQSLMDDQSLAASELDKLSLFAAGRGTPVTRAAITELIALEDQSSHFELIDLALDGHAKDLARRLPQIALEASAIPLLIGLLNQLKRLSAAHEIAASGVSGPAIGNKLTPRIFERQWPAFEKRMRTWTPPRVLALINRVADANMACRVAGSPQDAIAARLLIDIAQVAPPQRRQV